MSVTMVDENVGEQEDRLKIADRCDRCIARAFVIAEKDGNDLYFCNHHFNTFEDQLVLQGFAIHNESHRLYAEEALETNSIGV